jgi:hypothetical protein
MSERFHSWLVAKYLAAISNFEKSAKWRADNTAW